MGDFITGLLLLGLAVESFGCHAADPVCNTSLLKLTQLAAEDIARGRAEARRLKAEADEAAKIVASPEELAARPALYALNLHIGGDLLQRQTTRNTAEFCAKSGGFDRNQVKLYRAQSLHPIRQQIFSGPIPETGWQLIGTLAGLEDLDIIASDLPAIAWKNIAQLKSLRRLRTCNCGKVTGDLTQLAGLSRLEVLDLDFGFVFQYPLWRKKMRGQLSDAEVAYRDEFVKKRPKWGAECAEAAIVTDRLIEQLAPLKNLRSISFTNTYISKRGVKALTALSGLEKFDISFLDHDEEVVRMVASCPRLKKLSRLYLTDATFSGIANLLELEELDCRFGVTDAHVPQFLRYRKLQRLDLQENSMTNQGLLQLAKLKALKQLDVRKSRHIKLEAVQSFRKLRPDCKIAFVDANF